MQRMTTAEATVESLLRHGIDQIYALPGVHNDHLFDAIHRSDGRMRVLHTRHEQTAAYMALGAAMAANLWLGLYSAPGEWPWTYGFLIIIQLLFVIDPPGRSLGVDALRRGP